MSYKLLVKDAFWQIAGRILSAVGGFVVTKIMAPYLGPLRYGDYSTILKFFAIWSAFADFGTYVIALRELGKIKDDKQKTAIEFSKYTGARYFMIIIVYSISLGLAYFIPSYISNPYIAYGLPIGMLFSASFMAAGIQQIPLQLFWKMEKLTIALTLSRVFQILFLAAGVYFIRPNVSFDNGANQTSLIAFCFVMFSVLISGIVQNIYVHIVSQKILKVKLIFDFKFIFALIKKNLRYGLGYYISSFHFLLVLILLSIFYPTVEKFDYVGIWAFALSLVEILLIVPSSLGNSFIHRISSQSDEEKKSGYGNLLVFIIWLGFVFMINFTVFSSSIIYFVGGAKFMGFNAGVMGAEMILPYLSIVLFLSFIKQIFNYYFVTFDRQNDLFAVNLIGLIIGASIGIPLMLKYNILGGVITQLGLEVLYTLGAFRVVWKNKIIPKVDFKSLGIISLIMLVMFGVGRFLKDIFDYHNFFMFLLIAFILNITILFISYKPVKGVLRKI